MKTRCSKRAFTLLEVMIVIGLLAMVGSLLAVKGVDLFRVYGFRQEVALVKSRVDFAKYCALTYEADIEVRFSQQGRHLCLSFSSDEPYLAKHPLLRDSLKFSRIKVITDKQGSCIHSVLFSGTGWMFPLSDLLLCGDKNQKEKLSVLGYETSFLSQKEV